MGSNFKFHLSNPQKALPWPERRIMTYCTWGCVQRCDLWPWRMDQKKTETFMRQTGYLARPPTSTKPPEILHMGSCRGSSYIFQVSWKSVEGSRSSGGSKIALFHWQGPQLVLPYKPWLCLQASAIIGQESVNTAAVARKERERSDCDFDESCYSNVANWSLSAPYQLTPDLTCQTSTHLTSYQRWIRLRVESVGHARLAAEVWQ